MGRRSFDARVGHTVQTYSWQLKIVQHCVFIMMMMHRHTPCLSVAGDLKIVVEGAFTDLILIGF